MPLDIVAFLKSQGFPVGISFVVYGLSMYFLDGIGESRRIVAIGAAIMAFALFRSVCPALARRLNLIITSQERENGQ